MKRSYLILTYFYTPAISARAFRWSALAERWASQGHHVDVISRLERDRPAEEQLNGVNVFRVNSMLHELARRVVRPHVSTAPIETSTPSRCIMKAARWVYREIWLNLYWPDYGFLWYGPALRKARYLATTHNYDVLISVSPLFTSHLVGEQVSREFNPCCWLVDCGDPFSLQEIEPHNNIRLYRLLNEKVERRILKKASAVTVTTEPTKEMYLSHFPESAGKVEVIPPLLSIPLSLSPHLAASSDGRIRLAYAGLLYPETRPPDFLLKLLAGLLEHSDLRERLELHLYGDIRLVHASFKPFKHLIEQGSIILHGMSDRSVVVRAMEEADVLVNIGNKTAYQLPSKTIEYASTGKPILNLIQLENDASRSIYESYPGALNLLDQGEAALDAQVDILRRWIADLPTRADSDFLEQWLANYKLDAIGGAYDNLIARLLEKTGLPLR